MNILGLNAFHGDSSACLMVGGQLVAAAEEERFRRIKHWAGFPSKAIAFCLEHAGLSLADIDVIAINTDPKAARFRKIAYACSGRASVTLLKEKLLTRKKRLSVIDNLQVEFPAQTFSGKLEFVEHHIAHLASAFNVSPYDQASVISVDGFGDFASAAWGYGSKAGSRAMVDVQARVYFPHSMGIFYQALTQYLGFPHYGDEYKVMGLAPYGKPALREQMAAIVATTADGSFRLNLDYFLHHKQPIGFDWDNDSPKVSQLYSDKLTELLGPARTAGEPLSQHHYNVASSIQDAYERVFFHMLNCLHAKHNTDNLTLAGGCGMNSVANGKIQLKTPYKHSYIQAAAGDAGGAIGAALVAGQRHGQHSDFVMNHAYWGNCYSDDDIKDLLSKHQSALDDIGCLVKFNQPLEALTDQVSNHIIDGKVIGWFQGAMEWGPRALGNRSILADPRRTDMQDILNQKIKRRESFRPFAPSVLKEHVKDWFESDADVPFMMKVFQVQAHQREKIPAVTHVDGSGRLQTVTRDVNEKYYRLIDAFYNKTQVPMLLNTSFNENEPVVCQPEEALACFMRTDMDVLVLGSHLIERHRPTS